MRSVKEGLQVGEVMVNSLLGSPYIHGTDGQPYTDSVTGSYGERTIEKKKCLDLVDHQPEGYGDDFLERIFLWLMR